MKGYEDYETLKLNISKNNQTKVSKTIQKHQEPSKTRMVLNTLDSIAM